MQMEREGYTYMVSYYLKYRDSFLIEGVKSKYRKLFVLEEGR